MRRYGRSLGAALSVAAGLVLAPLAMRLAWSWPHRVAVDGHSMEPALRHGDWLLVDPDSYKARTPRLGEIVVSLFWFIPRSRDPRRYITTERLERKPAPFFARLRAKLRW